MAGRNLIKKKLIQARTKSTGVSPYVRGKVKVDNALNLRVSKFISDGKVNQVVTRRDVNALIRLARGRSAIAKKAEARLRQLCEDGILVKERGLGKLEDNPHIELMWFEKLTLPADNINVIRENAKRKSAK